jgi:hypothetical protein
MLKKSIGAFTVLAYGMLGKESGLSRLGRIQSSSYENVFVDNKKMESIAVIGVV